MARIVRWEPLREMATLHNEVNRIFGTLFDTPTAGAAPVARRFTPAMDVVDEGGRYVLRADLPGMDEGDVAIEVEGDVLTISGERRSETDETTDGRRRIERSYGSFRRAMTLPAGVDAERISATFDKGVLEVVVPKPELAAPKRVQINAGPAQPVVEAGEPAGDAQADAA